MTATERQRKWRARNRERSNEIARQSWQRNRERNNARQNLTSRRRFLKFRYGLSEADYDQMLVEQLGVCAICKSGTAPWNVDHDHQTGAVRSLLCRECNLGLGNFHDSPEFLLSAASYLLRHTKGTTP